MQIILASNSPRRRELVGQVLNKYDVKFEIEPSDIFEDELQEKITDPQALVEALSQIKAEHIYSRYEDNEGDYVIIGADTVVHFDNRILRKTKR